MRVGDLSETELLARITPDLPRGSQTLIGPGDDSAVVALDGDLVVSTDVLVQDRHFRMHWGSGADVGWRAAAQNLADIAAMGARPVALVVALVLPKDLPVAWVVDLARGLGQACEPHEVGVVGGDLAGGDAVIISVTAHGQITGAPVLRSGAQVGDVIAVHGVLGHARAGYELLEASRAEPNDFVTAFLRPTPPIAAGVAAREAGASAMMDISDGLVTDAARIAAASTVDLNLHGELLRSDVAAVQSITDHDQAMHWVLTGGEDHGLLATFPPQVDLPPGFRRIGEVRSATPDPGPMVRLDGQPAGGGGWDHFRSD